jgi:hypothetical protein
MMLELVHPLDTRSIPSADYQYVYENKEPPPLAHIWLAATSCQFTRAEHYCRGFRITLPGEPTVGLHEPPNAYSTAMIVGHLMIALMGLSLPTTTLRMSHTDLWIPARRGIWPPGGRSWFWPPEVVLRSRADIQNFVEQSTQVAQVTVRNSFYG